MKIMFTAAAALVALAAMPAVAALGADATTAAEQPAKAPRIDKKQYCFEGTPTASRVPMRICRTRAEWKSRGVDVDNPEAD